jgi:hypothetical protein
MENSQVLRGLKTMGILETISSGQENSGFVTCVTKYLWFRHLRGEMVTIFKKFQIFVT